MNNEQAQKEVTPAALAKALAVGVATAHKRKLRIEINEVENGYLITAGYDKSYIAQNSEEVKDTVEMIIFNSIQETKEIIKA